MMGPCTVHDATASIAPQAQACRQSLQPPTIFFLLQALYPLPARGLPLPLAVPNVDVPHDAL